MERLCACGCGKEVGWNKQKKKWNKFVLTHNGRRRKIFDESHPPLCSCGCGNEVGINRNTKTKWNEFINGHQFKGKTHTKESIAKISKSGMGRTHTVSDEAKQRISKSNIGKKRSDKTKQRLKEAWKKRNPVSEETKINVAIGHMKPILKNGYCPAWGDREYINDLRETSCENCGITNMMSLKLFGSSLIVHHANGKLNCEPWDVKTLCRSCHSRLHRVLERKQNINQLR